MASMKPKVQPDDLDAAFFNAVAKEGAVCLQNCSDCGNWTHPARYFCPQCGSEHQSFRPISGKATIHSYTISHFSVEPQWKDKVPYAAIVAETAEGPRLVTRTEIPRDRIAIGMPIRVTAQVMDKEFSFFWSHLPEDAA